MTSPNLNKISWIIRSTGSGDRGAGQRRALMWLLLVSSILVAHVCAVTASADGSWVRLPLKHGQTDGNAWQASALVPKHTSRTKLCVKLSVIEPEKVEGIRLGHDATECGSLRLQTDSVTGSVAAGDGTTRFTLIARLYVPSVRTATVKFRNGSIKTYRLRFVKRPVGGRTGFRYLVIPALANACVRSVATHDSMGKIVHREASEACPAGRAHVPPRR